MKFTPLQEMPPSFFAPTSDWSNVTIRKTTPLYDLYNEIIAYCVDIQNADTGKNAYIVINADEKGTPVLQYAPDATSPYYDIGNSRALYLAPGAYHVIDGDMIVDLTTEETIAKSSLTIKDKTETRSSSDVSAETLVKNEYVRAAYLSGSSQRSNDTRETILNGVPNWHWQYGCVPTAIGMQLAKLYPSLNDQNTIGRLASALGTDSNGVTIRRYIPDRLVAFITRCGFATPSYCDYPAVDSVGNPLTGIGYNSYTTYKSEIDAGRPVAIYSENASVSIPGYSSLSGWESHMITGIGYSYVISGYDKYVVTYTTSAPAGRVYININSQLGAFAWLIVRP